MKMTEALLAHEIDGALVDNYVLTHSLNLIQKEPIRIERYIDHSITYGVVLPKNSSRFEKCVRSFLQNHPQEIFEIIADNLVPLKVSVNSNFCFFFNFLNLVILVSSQCSLDFTGTMRFMKSSNFFHPVEQDRNETEIWVGVILKTLKELMWKETKRHHVSATKNQTKQKKNNQTKCRAYKLKIIYDFTCSSKFLSLKTQVIELRGNNMSFFCIYSNRIRLMTKTSSLKLQKVCFIKKMSFLSSCTSDLVSPLCSLLLASLGNSCIADRK